MYQPLMRLAKLLIASFEADSAPVRSMGRVALPSPVETFMFDAGPVVRFSASVRTKLLKRSIFKPLVYEIELALTVRTATALVDAVLTLYEAGKVTTHVYCALLSAAVARNVYCW